jgi:hypothetical protein
MQTSQDITFKLPLHNKTSRLMLFGTKVAVFSKGNIEHKYNVGANEEFFNISSDG